MNEWRLILLSIVVVVLLLGAGGAGVILPASSSMGSVEGIRQAGVVLIGEVVVDAPTSSVRFENIPQTYRHLHLVMQARSDAPDRSGANVSLRFNDDGGEHYAYAAVKGSPGEAVGVFGAVRANRMEFVDVPAGLAAANYPGNAVIEIPYYSDTTFNKTVLSQSGFIGREVAGDLGVYQGSGWWASTAGITDIEVFILNPAHGRFVTGSTFALYGIAGDARTIRDAAR